VTTPTDVTAGAKPFALLEMFSSEGCMNCPAAYPIVDQIVTEYKQDNHNVILLDYHVDYWNRGGWSDPFSNKAYTNRQLAYARAFQNSGLYTPQMVVNGQKEFVASDAAQERDAIGIALTVEPTYSLELSMEPTDKKDSFYMQYHMNSLPEGSVLYVALVQDKATTEVKAGENKGRTLTHYSVVRAMTSRPLVSTDGKISVPIIKPRGNDDAKYSVVAFIQQKDMQITGVAKTNVPTQMADSGNSAEKE
jgi:hypothetical protein